jgi:hypothetical protein
MKWFKIIGAGIGIVFLIALFSAHSNRNIEQSVAASSFICEQGHSLPGEIVGVKGQEHFLYIRPDESSERVINTKATSILKTIQYHSIDSSTQVQLQCENGEWVRVQIKTPEWLSSVIGWVKKSTLEASLKEGEVREYSAEDIYWDNQTELHKDLIVKAINRIHKEDPRCRENIEVGSVAQSPTKSKPRHPVFFVTCGEGVNFVNVFFDAEDVASTKAFTAPSHINESTAINLCEEYAKQHATHSSTVNFSRFMDLAVTEHPNGRTSVMSSFTAKNDFNLELKYNIRCLLDEKGLIEANVIEAK